MEQHKIRTQNLEFYRRTELDDDIILKRIHKMHDGPKNEQRAYALVKIYGDYNHVLGWLTELHKKGISLIR